MKQQIVIYLKTLTQNTNQPYSKEATAKLKLIFGYEYTTDLVTFCVSVYARVSVYCVYYKRFTENPDRFEINCLVY